MLAWMYRRQCSNPWTDGIDAADWRFVSSLPPVLGYLSITFNNQMARK